MTVLKKFNNQYYFIQCVRVAMHYYLIHLQACSNMAKYLDNVVMAGLYTVLLYVQHTDQNHNMVRQTTFTL